MLIGGGFIPTTVEVVSQIPTLAPVAAKPLTVSASSGGGAVDSAPSANAPASGAADSGSESSDEETSNEDTDESYNELSGNQKQQAGQKLVTIHQGLRKWLGLPAANQLGL